MRSSGILMHITSLPGPYGIGTMGRYAYQFVDFLQRSGQSYWQILPLGPTGYGDSPYQTFSTFAGNPYLIDLDMLQEDGLLLSSDLEEYSWGEDEHRVNYGMIYHHRFPVLKRAFSRFDQTTPSYLSFLEENSSWLDDYALFMAVKSHFNGNCWLEWKEDIRTRKETALAFYREELKNEISFYQFLQFCFFTQWRRLHQYANDHGVRIIGDVPIYVPLDSADVWSSPENYQLDADRRPRLVAGVPPDYFSADGQLWGNPIYDWEQMKINGYSWWIRRMQTASSLFDVVRIDHFRGLESYWAVPYGEQTARNGSWQKGPGKDLIFAFRQHLPQLEVIAEDLGFLTPEVIELVNWSGYPGMKVLEFAFDPREPSNYLPHTYDKNCVCYTGTHDNEPLAQWASVIAPDCREYTIRYLDKPQHETLPRAVIRAGMASVSNLFVSQLQDWLELGKESRMNCPGILSSDNWSWRLTSDQIPESLDGEIRAMTRLYGRIS